MDVIFVGLDRLGTFHGYFSFKKLSSFPNRGEIRGGGGVI